MATWRKRRLAGESLTVFADEYGTSWQKIDKAVRNGLPGEPVVIDPPGRQPTPAVIRTKVTRGSRPGPLTERYRPANLAEIVGQPDATAFLRGFATEPYPAVMLFEGVTGIGKTSAAVALAEALGCNLAEQEFGGVHEIASGEQNADAVRETYRRIWLTPMFGSGWKVVIVNEADRMNVAAETIWLDRLESLPPRTVIVFTTNYAPKLSRRFRDRCTRLEFDGTQINLEGATIGLLAAIWKSEVGQRASIRTLRKVVRDAAEGGQLSIRRAIQMIVPMVMAAKGGGSCG